MTEPRGINSRVERLADDVAQLSDDLDDVPVTVIAGEELLDDPRLDELVAQARRERRSVVTPWEETEAGELVDTSSDAYAAAQPAHVIQLPRRDPDPPPTSS